MGMGWTFFKRQFILDLFQAYLNFPPKQQAIFQWNWNYSGSKFATSDLLVWNCHRSIILDLWHSEMYHCQVIWCPLFGWKIQIISVCGPHAHVIHFEREAQASFSKGGCHHLSFDNGKWKYLRICGKPPNCSLVSSIVNPSFHQLLITWQRNWLIPSFIQRWTNFTQSKLQCLALRGGYLAIKGEKCDLF